MVEDVAVWKRTRYLITCLALFHHVMMFTTRTALSIAIVAMTDPETNPDFETFAWNTGDKGTALSSFFWGYVVSCVPAGLLFQRYGVRWLLLAVHIVNATATCLIPTAAYQFGVQGVWAFRIIQGLCQGFINPSLVAILTPWSPPTERGRLLSICLSGMNLGNILALSSGGQLAAGPTGWPSIFYVFGGLSFGWCVLWFFLGFDTPKDHPLISKQEKEYIESFYVDQMKQPSFKTPMWRILTSIPVWAVLLSHCTFSWGFYVILTEIPTYMNKILNYNVSDNGGLTSIAYAVMFVCIYIFAYIADQMTARGIKLKWARKLMNTIGLIGPMFTMIGLGYLGKDQKDWAVVLLAITCGLNAGIILGYVVTPTDITTNFPGVVMGMSTSLGNVFSLLVPLVVAAMIEDEYSQEDWAFVFWVTAGVYLFGTIIFLVFSSHDIQPWNKPDDFIDEQTDVESISKTSSIDNVT